MLLHQLLFLIFLTLFASAVPFDSKPTRSQPIILQFNDPHRTPSGPGNSRQGDSELPEINLALDDSNCSPRYEFYGKGHWTYKLVHWCFEQTDNTTAVIQEQANPSYYWGGTWYRGGQKALTWRTKCILGMNGFNSGKNSNDGPVKKQVAEIKADLSSGKHYNALVL